MLSFHNNLYYQHFEQSHLPSFRLKSAFLSLHPFLQVMAAIPFHEGKVSFEVPERSILCETYYKVYGDLRSGIPPLVVLHGGPGSGHEYVEPFSKLLSSYDIPVILYDQIGCGKSTHLRDTMGDLSFWQPSLFVAELENLVTHLDISNGPGFDVLGHSWGGTLAIAFAARQPAGLRRLVIANANASGQLLKQNIWKLSRNLSAEHQKAIDEAVRKEEFESPGYLAAMGDFMKMYLCRADPYPPPELAADNKNQSEDRTVRRTMSVNLSPPHHFNLSCYLHTYRGFLGKVAPLSSTTVPWSTGVTSLYCPRLTFRLLCIIASLTLLKIRPWSLSLNTFQKYGGSPSQGPAICLIWIQQKCNRKFCDWWENSCGRRNVVINSVSNGQEDIMSSISIPTALPA